MAFSSTGRTTGLFEIGGNGRPPLERVGRDRCVCRARALALSSRGRRLTSPSTSRPNLLSRSVRLSRHSSLMSTYPPSRKRKKKKRKEHGHKKNIKQPNMNRARKKQDHPDQEQNKIKTVIKNRTRSRTDREPCQEPCQERERTGRKTSGRRPRTEQERKKKKGTTLTTRRKKKKIKCGCNA